MNNGIPMSKEPYDNFPGCGKCDPHCGPCEPNGCEKTAKHYIDISLPVDIKPDAIVGQIEMECCGDPTVICDDKPPFKACHLMLIQKVCVKIPVCYSFSADVNKSIIDCCPPCGK